MHHRRTMRPVAAVGLTALLTACLGGAAFAQTTTYDVDFVVRVSHELTKKQVERSVPSLTIERVRDLGHDVASIRVRTQHPDAAADALDASPLISHATESRRFTVAGTKAPVAIGDSYAKQQWDLWDASSTKRAGGYGIDAPRAWTVTKGSPDVVVAVLDTGITDHPDLAGASIAPGYDFVSMADGIDPGDGDGWDADPTDEGDACDDEGSSWHGTFVASEIVAQRNGRGVVGAAPGVTLEPVRVLGACGGDEADTIAAIEWASGGEVAGVPINTRPAQIISMSLGSSDGACSAALQTAVSDAIGRGVVVVAAAGNEGTRMSTTSPANCAGVISVTASTRDGALADYSNYGTSSYPATIAAPGGSASRPVLGDGWRSTTTLADDDTAVVEWSEGTSMATPRVSAAIALLLSEFPGLTPDQVAQQLVLTATSFPKSARCTTDRCGVGIVNAGNLVGAQRLFVQATDAKVVGTAKAGKRLVASAGTWRSAPQRVRYQWLRDGKAIAGATAKAYRVTAKDAGHRISVQVQVERTNTLTAKATSSARRIVR